ncbi:hypothetical protein [Vitiosangium sp. GDMCC 1.1324]|uniref:hypothetical protein n=1 Tax=Vitiosangium sp. (strain GDMCC 1.1324) TaxID=2138576 RepID=UPI000D3AA3E1|nr:hypothetical protein [Vitiosangium sp. GDMCC 1.1324]PTL78428.1 hypothetical protein DAT35_38495 [Vitiosangium sp. GDMCC 1.1324]
MQVTTWFIAKEDEAEAIESIVTTEEHSPEDWTYIELPLIEMELMALSAALRGTEDITSERTLEKPLVFREEDGLIVARVVDSFIQALARITEGNVPDLADAWAERTDQEHHEPEELREILSDMADFARQAVAHRSPVLSLATF